LGILHTKQTWWYKIGITARGLQVRWAGRMAVRAGGTAAELLYYVNVFDVAALAARRHY
jgi:hypothetical protein